VRDAEPDEVFTRSGRRHRRRAVVGVGARADHRRIADPAPALAGDAAGRGCGGDVAVRVAGDRADGAVFHRAVERRPGFGELARAFGGVEPRGVDLFEAGGQREGIGPDAGKHDVRCGVEHRAGEADRVAGPRHSRDRSGTAVGPVHDRGVEFDRPVGGEDGAAPGVEFGGVLEAGHRRLDRIERTAARREHRCPRIERGGERGARCGISIWRQVGAAHAARAAVDGERPGGEGGEHCGVVAGGGGGGNRSSKTAVLHPTRSVFCQNEDGSSSPIDVSAQQHDEQKQESEWV
jgi:hypothetical protein